MAIRRIFLILPCHSLDSFPTHYEDEEAAGLLAAWTAPWHPQWIADVGEAPAWVHVDEATADRLHSSIVLTPKAVESHLPDDFSSTVSEAAADRLGHFSDRHSLVKAIEELQGASSAIHEDLIADFHALGYWYLQIELLSRQISYHSNLDEYQFRERVVAAAQHAVAGEHDAAKEMLQKCYGMLAEERDHYYPVDAYLLDLALVAPTTTPAHVQREIERTSVVNLWMTGEKLQQLHDGNNDFIKSLANAIDRRSIGLLGGEFGELPLPLLSVESLRCEWLRGLQTFRTHLGERPISYFRRRFGLTPRLASLLRSFGWIGALHATLDAGRFPTQGQACSQWKDKDAAGIAMISRVPLDAARPETFLRLSLTMGESMESDYVATLVLARWVGTECEWFEDVRRAAPYGLRLGQATTCDDYFQSNHPDSHGQVFRPDQYRSPYLQQSVTAQRPNPISSWVRCWRTVNEIQAATTLGAFAAAIGGSESNKLRAFLADCEEQSALNVNATGNGTSPLTSPDDALLMKAGQFLANTIASTADDSDQAKAKGWLVLNAHSHPQRLQWELEAPIDTKSNDTDSNETDSVQAVCSATPPSQVTIDVPGSGFAWLPVDDKVPEAIRESLIQDTTDDANRNIVLRNEFCAVHISHETGGIAGLYDFSTRGNRLSQRLVRRTPAERVTQMRCDRLEIVSDTSVVGQVKAHGRLVFDDDELYAHFTQTISLARGSRVARLEIQVDLVDPPSGSPWHDYVACRWAWPGNSDELHRCVQGVMYPTDGKRCESQSLFEIDDGRRRTALLTGGLPYHHRCGERMLDSLLVVAGETETHFELAVGVDLPQAIEQAESYWLPVVAVPCPAPPAQSGGWLFHIGSKHVRMTGCTPIWDDQHEANQLHGNCLGMRLRLQEQSGGAGSFKVRGPRPIVTAVKTDFVASIRNELSVEEGAVIVTIDGNEWTEVECRW